jgi:hypothetical protein
MSENEIKPVAWVDLETWKATYDAGDSFFTDYQDEDTVAVYDQSAIDRLTAEREEAQRKLSVAVAEGKALVADAERYRFLRNPPDGNPQPAAWIEGRGNEFIESEWLTGEFADVAIDAARSEGGV